MTLGTSIVLCDIVDMFLNGTTTNEKGETVTFTRNLPAKLLYKLTRCKSTLEKDKAQFEKERVYYITKYGTQNEKGIDIEESNLPSFQQDMISLLETPITHSVNMITPDDFENLSLQVKVPLTEELMKVFMAFLVEDDALLSDISKTIDFKIKTRKEEPLEEIKEETLVPTSKKKTPKRKGNPPKDNPKRTIRKKTPLN